MRGSSVARGWETLVPIDLTPKLFGLAKLSYRYIRLLWIYGHLMAQSV